MMAAYLKKNIMWDFLVNSIFKSLVQVHPGSSSLEQLAKFALNFLLKLAKNIQHTHKRQKSYIR
jgi:hypothetical protein